MKDIKVILAKARYFILFTVALVSLSACVDVDGDDPPPLIKYVDPEFEGINLNHYETGKYFGEISSDSIAFTTFIRGEKIGVTFIACNGKSQKPCDSLYVSEDAYFKFTAYNEEWGKIYYTMSEDECITHFIINENNTGKPRIFYLKLLSMEGLTQIALEQLTKEGENQ